MTARDVVTAGGADVLDSTRLFAMVDVIGADAGIAVMQAKYHYLFWRPVTVIDPTSVTAADGFGPSPGYDDGNPSTSEQVGWRPLLTTPNHPEYPSAHGSVSGAIALAFASFLGTDQINLTIHGFDPTPGKPATNLDAVRTFATPDDLLTEIVNARVWAGLHYRFSESRRQDARNEGRAVRPQARLQAGRRRQIGRWCGWQIRLPPRPSPTSLAGRRRPRGGRDDARRRRLDAARGVARDLAALRESADGPRSR